MTWEADTATHKVGLKAQRLLQGHPGGETAEVQSGQNLQLTGRRSTDGEPNSLRRVTAL